MNFTWQTEYLGNSVLHWLYAAAMAVGLSLLLLLIRSFARRKKEFKKEGLDKFQPVKIVILMAGMTNPLALVALSVFAGSFFLAIPASAQKALDTLMIFAAALQIGVWASGLFDLYIRQRAFKKMEDDAAQATSLKTLGIVGRIFIWIIVIMVAADNIAGVNITALITSLGVGGIAVGFALQKILQDIFASLTISLDKPFAIGDFLDLGDHRGTIEKIGLKSTVLRAPTGERVIIGNANLLDNRIRNYGKFEERFGDLSFGVHPDTPQQALRQIPQIISTIIAGIESTDLVRIHLKNLGSSTLDFGLVYKCRGLTYNQFLDVRQEILLRLLEKFHQERIIMPFPIQKILLERSTEEN